jgi:hypothetical protein
VLRDNYLQTALSPIPVSDKEKAWVTVLTMAYAARSCGNAALRRRGEGVARKVCGILPNPSFPGCGWCVNYIA